MGGFYINYYFENIEYDDSFYAGIFSAPDQNVYCEFIYTTEMLENLLKSVITISR